MHSPRLTRPLAAALALIASSAIAQTTTTWPDKPVRLVVPYSPSGTTDYAARQIAQKLTEQTGKSFYVENRVGASGTIGSDLVAKAAPDGSTFLINDTTYAMLPHLFKKLPWDHATGLVPVTRIVDTPLVVVVGANSPYKSMQELIDAARKNPDKLTFGSGGMGSSSHLGGELLRQHGKIALTHVPYKGAGEAMLGVISGQVDLVVTAAPTAIPQVKGGKGRALLVTSPQRLAALPDAPTSAQLGLQGFTATNWFGIAAPKGTPQAIIDKMQAEVKKAVESPDLAKRFADQGADVGAMAPADFQKYVRSQTEDWGRVIKAAGVQAE